MQRDRESGKLPHFRNGLGWPSRMLKKSPFSPSRPRRAETRLFPCIVLASLRGSTYQKDSRRSEALEGLFRSPRSIARANGSHEVRFVPPSPLRSLRPCWTGGLSILRSVFLLSNKDHLTSAVAGEFLCRLLGVCPAVGEPAVVRRRDAAR